MSGEFLEAVTTLQNSLLALKRVEDPGANISYRGYPLGSNEHYDVYRGMHLGDLSDAELNANKKYYKHSIQAGLELCEILLHAMKTTPRTSSERNWTDGSTFNIVSTLTDHPMALYLASDRSNRGVHMYDCLSYFDKSTMLPQVVDLNMQNIAHLFTDFFKSAQRDKAFMVLINNVGGFIQAIPGVNINLDVNDYVNKLEKASAAFSRKKEMYALHKQALEYEQAFGPWLREWEAALTELDALSNALPSDILNDRERLEQRLQELRVQEDRLNLLHAKLKTFPERIVKSGYLDALLKRPLHKGASIPSALKKTLDREWQALLTAASFEYKATAVQQYIAAHEQSMAKLQAAILACQKHPQNEVVVEKALPVIAPITVPSAAPSSVKTGQKSVKKPSMLMFVQRVLTMGGPSKSGKMPSAPIDQSTQSFNLQAPEVDSLSHQSAQSFSVSKATTERELYQSKLRDLSLTYSRLLEQLQHAKTPRAILHMETKIEAQRHKDAGFFITLGGDDADLRLSFNALQQQRTDLEQALRYRCDLQAFKADYFRGKIPIPEQKPQQSEALFNAYLRERSQHYSVRDKMDLLAKAIFFPVYCSLYWPLYYLTSTKLWYETSLTKREKYLIKLEKATQAYQTHPSNETIHTLRAVIHEELDKKSTIIQHYTPAYFSKKTKEGDTDRSLLAKLKTFETAVNALEKKRPQSQSTERVDKAKSKKNQKQPGR